MTIIHLSETLYDMILERAAKRQQSPDDFVEEFLAEHLQPPHPYVEIIQSRSQPRAVIKGTRIGIDVIIGYTQAGYSPQEIATDILPDLTLAQIYDALSYYEDHRSIIDEVIRTNSAEVWRQKLQQRLGKQAAEKLLGS